MKIVAISDTHDQHRRIKIPECDLFIHAGDFTCHRKPQVRKYIDFDNWLGEITAKNKVVVAGNHDILFEKEDGHKYITNAIYLENESVEIEGKLIWGSPNSLFWDHWAFGSDEETSYRR